MLARIHHTLGALRLFLAVSTVVVICTAPFAIGASYHHDWRILPTVVAPSVMVMLLFVLPLDMMMTRVFLSGAPARDEQLRLRTVLRVEMVLWLLMLLAWLPFMRSLLR